MKLYEPKDVKEYIINELFHGEKSTTNLLNDIQDKYRITKQGFYLALKKLKKNEVIIVYNKMVKLDSIWATKTKELLDEYLNDTSKNQILNLSDRESVSYKFSSIKHLDTLWGDAQETLALINPKNAIFSYDPHYWFYIVRQKREEALLQKIVARKQQFLMTVGSESGIDKSIKMHFTGDLLQYNHKKLFEKNNFYITLIGEYIIEVTLDKKISDEIDRIYSSNTEITEEVIEQLGNILSSKTKNKIKISRNRARGVKLYRKFKKDFYIIK